MQNKQYLHYLGFLAGSLLISVGCQLLLPWPFGLVVALGIFVVAPLVINTKTIRTTLLKNMDKAQVKYRCLVCSKTNNTTHCSRCGSNRAHAAF